ncbi:MAG: phosphoglycerate kinase [Candidatus Micrarchaeia archaeon]
MNEKTTEPPFKGGEGFLTLDWINLAGKIAVIRLDLNSPVRDGVLIDDERIRAHAGTVAEVARKADKVILLSHQGRPGENDFIPLRQHWRALEKYAGIPILYPWKDKSDEEIIAMGEEAVIGDRIMEMLQGLKKGQVILLENVRLLPYETVEKSVEEHAKSPLVERITSLGEIVFVLDGFSVAHRPHCSVIGFAQWPTVAGRVMEKELRALTKAFMDPKEPIVLITGGVKVSDSIKSIQNFLERARGKAFKVLTCGAVGEVFLAAKGIKLPDPVIEFMRHKKIIDQIEPARLLLAEHSKAIEVPVDVAIDVGGKREEVDIGEIGRHADKMIKDIGGKTAYGYAERIITAKTIIGNGTAGVYEEREFAHGQSILLQAAGWAAKYKGATTLFGGGDTTASLRQQLSGDLTREIFTSTSGKAFLRALSSREGPRALAGVNVLLLKQSPVSGR